MSRTVSMPFPLFLEVDNRAESAGVNFSEKLVQLLRKGILFEDKYQAPSVSELLGGTKG